MRKELSSPVFVFFILFASCLTLASGRASLASRQASPGDPFVPGVFPWDPPVSNIGHSVTVNSNYADYSISMTIVKTVTSASVSFSAPVPLTSVAVMTEGWTVSFDGTTVNATLERTVTAGTAVKVTLRVVVTGGSSFVFPTVLRTSCVFSGKPETQTFPFAPSTGVQPTAAQTPSGNFISSAGQALSSDGAGTNQFTYTFRAFRALDNLSVRFSFPNTNVITVVSASAGATASFDNGVVTVTYANVGVDTVSTTVTVTTNGELNLPNQFNFTTVTAGTPQTQVMTFSSSPATPGNTDVTTTAPRKPLGYSHLDHGIKAGRTYLELVYYLDIVAGSDLDNFYVQFALPMDIFAAEGDAATTVTLTSNPKPNTLKLVYQAPVAKGAKATVTAYFKVDTYVGAGLPDTLDFYYTVAGTAHHKQVKFT